MSHRVRVYAFGAFFSTLFALQFAAASYALNVIAHTRERHIMQTEFTVFTSMQSGWSLAMNETMNNENTCRHFVCTAQ